MQYNIACGESKVAEGVRSNYIAILVDKEGYIRLAPEVQEQLNRIEAMLSALVVPIKSV